MVTSGEQQLSWLNLADEHCVDESGLNPLKMHDLLRDCLSDPDWHKDAVETDLYQFLALCWVHPTMEAEIRGAMKYFDAGFKKAIVECIEKTREIVEPKDKKKGKAKREPGESKGAIKTSVAATELAERYQSEFTYDTTEKAFLQYNTIEPNIWVQVPDETIQRQIKIDLEDFYPDGFEWSKVSGCFNMLKSDLARDIPPLPRHFIPYTNGVFDTRDMKLKPHDPDMLLRWSLSYAYDENADCQPIKDWMFEAMERDEWRVKILRAYLNAIIKRRVDLQVYLECIGPGGSGKGTFTRLAEALVGMRNVKPTDLVQLETNRFEVGQIRGKQLIIITDEDNYGGGVANLKKITGQDHLRGELKNARHHIDFVAEGMVLISANSPIQSSDYTSGLVRRRITIPFRVRPKQSRELILFEDHKPRGEFADYLPGLANWVLSMKDDEVTKTLKHSTISSPAMRNERAEIIIATNPLAEWANEWIIHGKPEDTVRVGSLKREDPEDKADEWLYPNYVRFMGNTGHKPVASNRFTGLLLDLCVSQLELKGVSKPPRDRDMGSYFCGIKLRKSYDTEDFLITKTVDDTFQNTDSYSSSISCDGGDKNSEECVTAQVIDNVKREGSDGICENISELSETEKEKQIQQSFAKNPSHPSRSTKSDTLAVTPPVTPNDKPVTQGDLIPSARPVCSECGGTTFRYGVMSITCETCGHNDIDE